jgi:cytochrome c oxidase assembly factor CtaG
VFVLATMGFPGVYQSALFWARAVQTVLLLLVVPLFLALGRPLTLMTAAVPGAGPRIAAVLGSRAAKVLTFPAVTALVLVITPFLLYFTPWYEASLRGGPAAELTHLVLLLPGLMFFWTLLRVDPVPKPYSYLVSLWVTGIEVLADAVLGLAVLADQHLIAGRYYLALARPWGPGPRTDQVLGGGVLWILGDLVGLPFFAAQLIQMIREDEREAAAVDAELDAAEAAEAAEAAQAVEAGQATEAWEALEAIGAAEAGQSLDATESTEVVQALEAAQAIETMQAAEAGKAAEPGQALEAGKSVEAGKAADALEAGEADGDARPVPGREPVSGRSRAPWWLTDPRFTGRFRPPA